MSQIKWHKSKITIKALIQSRERHPKTNKHNSIIIDSNNHQNVDNHITRTQTPLKLSKRHKFSSIIILESISDVNLSSAHY